MIFNLLKTPNFDLKLTYRYAKLVLSGNSIYTLLQAAKANFERDIGAREEAAEEKRKGLLRQLRDMESDLEEGKILT